MTAGPTVVEDAPASEHLHSLAAFPVKFLDNLLSGKMQPFGQTPSTSNQPSETNPSPFRQQAQYGMQHMTGQMTGSLERVRDWLQQWIQNSADTLRVYVNQYPPLAAFLFTLLVLSAVPVSVYVLFGLVTSAIFLTIALVGFSFVEGFILLTSGGILMAILSGIALFTTIGFAVISSIYLSYRGGCFLASNIWQASSQIGGQFKEAAQRVGQTMQSPHQQQQPYSSSGYTQSGGMQGGIGAGVSGASSS